MSVRKGEPIIDDSNYKKLCLDPTVKKKKADRKFTGLKPRDWKNFPCGSIPGIPKASIQKIPRTAWDAIIQEREERKALLSDIREKGKFGQRIPSLDQNGRGYCWAHSTTSCALIIRAFEGQEFADLSAYSIACKIKGFRDEGGWNKESVDFFMKYGCMTSEDWPQRGTSRSLDTPAGWERAGRYKLVEIADDIDEGDFDMQMTYALLGICGPLDLNWWSHSICACDPVRIEAGHYGIRIWNSWGDSYGLNGMAVLAESKARNNGFIALRSGTIAGLPSQMNVFAQGV